MNKHIVLGAGAIGNEVFNALKEQGKDVLLASKSARKMNGYIQIDALDLMDVEEKTKDISILYLCIGLPYNKKTWRKQFPVIIDNVIHAAVKNKFKFVFFDNVYMYGYMNNPVLENHPNIPISHKGETRKMMIDKILNARDLEFLIARSPDFFGPHAKNSILYTGFIDNVLKQKNFLFIGKLGKKHSYAYTKDLAKAMILLSEHQEMYQQIWHLPSYQTNSIEEIVSLVNQTLNTSYSIKTMGYFLNMTLSFFIPILREVKEMRYQFDYDYVLDDHKFMKAFPTFKKTDLEVALKETIESFK